MKFYRIHNYRVVMSDNNEMLGIFKIDSHGAYLYAPVKKISRKVSLMALRNAIDRDRLDRYIGGDLDDKMSETIINEYETLYWEGV